MMGGRLWVESQPGMGSIFHFTLHFKAIGNILENDANAGEQIFVAPSGLNILLAEDNPINQKLALTLLSQAGNQVVIANNGREAVELARQSNFDLVLMDMQMPEMGGIEATLLIREHESGARIPIIALTANAMQSDQQRCLEAGMDAYLSKPIQKAELFRLIAKVTGGCSTGAVQPTGHFDYLAALERSDKDIIEIIGEEFLRGIPAYLSAIDSALNKGEIEKIQRAAHTLKGVIGNFGAKPATECARRIEQAAESGDLVTAKENFQALQTEMATFQETLQTFLPQKQE
jgi:CheY-like chemotaxis protein